MPLGTLDGTARILDEPQCKQCGGPIVTVGQQRRCDFCGMPDVPMGQAAADQKAGSFGDPTPRPTPHQVAVVMSGLPAAEPKATRELVTAEPITTPRALPSKRR
jgi:hypothetical protein